MSIQLVAGIEDLQTFAMMSHLETDVLPTYLSKRRWFASKDKLIQSIKIVQNDCLTFGETSILVTKIAVGLTGSTETYNMLMGLAWDDSEPLPLAEALSLSRVKLGNREGFLTDAFALDALPLGLMHGLVTESTFELKTGSLHCVPTNQLSDSRPADDPKIVRLSAEQSNSSLVIDKKIIMKLIRRVAIGPNPEVEMVRYLTACNYENTPALLGEVENVASDGTADSVFVVQKFVPSDGDAWEYTLEYLRKSAGDPSGYMSIARSIGTRLAQMHAVLAMPNEADAFNPELVTGRDIDIWVQSAVEQVQAAFESMLSFESIYPDAAVILRHQQAIIEKLPAVAKAGIGTLKTRIHGDFHLGQILISNGDAFIIDFEGEPSKSIDWRRSKSSPLKDVAGLLRSLHYASAAAGLEDGAFVSTISNEFALAYREAERVAAVHWTKDEASQTSLIDLFLLEKSAYEICYEAANRPSWFGIPLRGFLDIVLRVLKISPETQYA